VSPAAIELAALRVPGAERFVSPLRELPFAGGSFDLVFLNDVVQHVLQSEVQPSLAEIHRVLRPDGTLLVRTNGTRRVRLERADWRVYDRRTLKGTLEQAGFQCERVT